MIASRRIYEAIKRFAPLSPIAVLACLLGACASMGRPQGGARDEEPPRFVSSSPAPGSLNTSPRRMTITFNENIQLDDAFNKVVVSPPQKTPPRVSSNARKVTVEFIDPLPDSATVTIDFSDAIKDLNEGNVLDGFALDFSTGPLVDTLRISGMVLEAETLEPAQGMLVGVYSDLSDTALTSVPLERIARTNQLGQFTIRGLKPGVYRVVAINDVNRDYHWDRSEDVAFYSELVSPTVEEISVTDTVYAADLSDSLVTRRGVRYLPNDILLTWFNTGYNPQYLKDYKREDRRRITINLAAEPDSLPVLTIVDGAPGAGRPDSVWALRKSNSRRDSLEYWITDPDVLAADSLRLAVTYRRTDSTENLVWRTDTLRFFHRDFTDKKKDKKKKKNEPEAPKFIVDSITGDTTFLPPPDMEYLTISARSGSQDLHKPLKIDFGVPLLDLDSSGVHLEMKVDTNWVAQKGFTMTVDSADVLRSRLLDIRWQPGQRYRLRIDTLAAHSVYGTFNRPFRTEFSTKNTEDYSNLRFNIAGSDSIAMVVQLLSRSDQPVAQAEKPAGTGSVDFRFLNPGEYYARLIIDSNANGKWDTGDPMTNRQPEDVYYYPKKINLRKNWDVEQEWTIDELPVDTQKPLAIKKNKPKLKRGEKQPGYDDEEEYDDDPLADPFDPRSQRGNRSPGYQGAGGRRQSGTTTNIAR